MSSSETSPEADFSLDPGIVRELLLEDISLTPEVEELILQSLRDELTEIFEMCKVLDLPKINIAEIRDILARKGYKLCY
jgi:hypothetical protein